MYRVFVYGTLKKGEPNHHCLTKPENGTAKFVGNAETTEKYPLIIATKYNIPFLLYKPNFGNFVKGEIYDVDEPMLRVLDILEDHPSFYERSVNKVKLIEMNELTDCWIYFLKKYQPHLLENQLFVEYKNDGAHGLKYCERYRRDPEYNHENDVYLN